MHSAPADPHTIEAALRGDLKAWDKVVDATLPVVLQWCRRLGGPRVDAHDATQEIFVIAFTRASSVHDANCFVAWLYGITRRVLAAHRRRAWLRGWVPGILIGERPATGEGTDKHELSELARQVQAILARLPVSQREVLVLCDMEERTSLEVSDLLGIPHGTVRSRLRLARERFRQESQGVLLFPSNPGQLEGGRR